jgi:hypothetical protein
MSAGRRPGPAGGSATTRTARGPSRRAGGLGRISGAAGTLDGVHESPYVFLERFERPLGMQFLKARPHVVAFRVGAHEPVQPLQPVADQLRLGLALRSSSAIVTIRWFAALNLAPSRSTFTSRSGTQHSPPPEELASPAVTQRGFGPVRGIVRTQLETWVLW